MLARVEKKEAGMAGNVQEASDRIVQGDVVAFGDTGLER